MITRRITRVGGPEASTAALAAEVATALVSSLLTIAQWHRPTCYFHSRACSRPIKLLTAFLSLEVSPRNSTPKVSGVP